MTIPTSYKNKDTIQKYTVALGNWHFMITSLRGQVSSTALNSATSPSPLLIALICSISLPVYNTSQLTPSPSKPATLKSQGMFSTSIL